MRIISHRGNLTGAEPSNENNPVHIEHVLNTTKLDIKIDVRLIGEHWFLGDSEPQYAVKGEWLMLHSHRLWADAKNLAALHELNHNPSLGGIISFWREQDRYALTSGGFIWASPGQEVTYGTVLFHLGPDYRPVDKQPYAICTDYPISYEN